ncbi:MAG: branched-chain amino acid ABC transporter permease [Halanaeroarchaeum sp.]
MTMPETRITDLLDPRTFALRHQIGLLVMLALGLAPVWIPLLYTGGQGLLFLRTLTSALFFGMFAMSWDIVSGYTGQISFGHSLFFAVGGYTSALLNLGWGVSPVFAIALGTVLTAVVGLVIGGPALRLEGPYLSLVTLVAPLILLQLFIVYSGIFGGELGIPNPEPLVRVAGGFAAETKAYFFVAFGLFVLILGILLAVTRSDAGSVFTAIREDEQAVAAAGLNPAKFKIFAFVLSAAVGGLAGAVFVHTIGKPSPSQLLVMSISIEVIIASIIGGMGTIVGASIGGIILVIFRSWLSNVGLAVPVIGIPIAELDLFLFSVVTLVLLFTLPGGLLRWGIKWGRTLLPARERVATDGGTTPIVQAIDRYRGLLSRLGGGDDE